MRKIYLIFALLFACLVVTNNAHATPNEYVIGKGDALSIRVWGEPELSAEALVRPDGKISLPNVGEITAAGLTPKVLRRQIAAALKEILFNPVVSVSVNSFPSNSMIVYGPGTVSTVVPLNGKMTLLKLLSSVRPDFNADLQNAYLERNGEIVATDFESLFAQGVGEQAEFEVLANDRLFIPKKLARLIFIEGAVNNPTSIPYSEQLTILEAIHKAGGFTKFADPNDTIVTRTSANGIEKIEVRLSDLIDDGDMSQNILLQGGDLIVVDTSWF